ncbi:Reticulocyte binding protein 2-like protein B [Plasmodium coatneyi]|uniref:Reticulocyte binding protein 2-like protein B n=1 Tax=Plasmodium coatneyi TaxID=208452 RepID=A0A1B1E5F8_9APIC|nr:Reticulocyte binding protein 2-like protein B [Plasmodium coatneyi]ANQ10238.1 Reticulocyte binding protein 2-like protein B [Plasmodium coatneyi]
MKPPWAVFLLLLLAHFLTCTNGLRKRVGGAPYDFLLGSRNNKQNETLIRRRHHEVRKKSVQKLKDVKDMHVGQLKVGRVANVVENEIFVKLKNDDNEQIIIKRENNYLLENELLYEYLYRNNFIDHAMYAKLMRKVTPQWKDQAPCVQNDHVKDCLVLIKEVDEKNRIIGELYTNEINKRKEKIYNKLDELKNSEKKIFIQIVKNVRNKYFVVLINGCIKGYLLYDENDEKDKQNVQLLQASKNATHKISAYIIEVNKKLEYVFLSLRKIPADEMNEKLRNLQHTIIVENLFENVYFKGEVSDFCNDGNNIIVNIFESKGNPIKVKIKSHNIINTRNILRNFDYLKNKVITHEFGLHNSAAVEETTEDRLPSHKMGQRRGEESGDAVHTGEGGPFDARYTKDITPQEKKAKGSIRQKDYTDKYKQFKQNFYGCNEEDALKYINVDDYIFKKEKLLYVRIVNKTSDPNLYEGSMVNADPINHQIYELIKKMSTDQNVIQNYNPMLRYPSKVLAFFNSYVILSTRVLSPEAAAVQESDPERGGDDKTSTSGTTGCNKINKEHVRDVITLIEKRYIDYENLKEGDIFFCRFDHLKTRNARNIFNLSNSTINKIFNSYFKREKDIMGLVGRRDDDSPRWDRNPSRGDGFNMGDRTKSPEQDKSPVQQIFEEIFFSKRDFYFMRGELHKDTEYRLNKNNIDKNFKLLKHICDTYYSGINKNYHHYPSIREEYILAYLGKDNYKLYRKIVADYFSSNEHSYKEFLQADCEAILTTVFDVAFENPNALTVQVVQNYNKELFRKISMLDINELNYMLKDLDKLKKKMYIYPCSYNNRIGRMNLILNNMKPIKKEHIENMNLREDVKNELLNVYKNFVFPDEYIKETIIKKKQAKCRENSKMQSIYILAEETINLYENSAKDVEPLSEEQIGVIRDHLLKKRRPVPGDMSENDSFRGDLFEPENSQIRRLLHMIKEDLEKQKKKNKLDEVDREYEEEQNSYTDATDLYKTYPELQEMDRLSEDAFHMKIPFVE